MNKVYVLKYWSGDKDVDAGKFLEIECTIEDDTIENLLTNKPNKFMRCFIGDGETLIIATNSIYDITQVYK